MNGLSGVAARPAADWLGARDPRLRLLAALGFALVTVSLHRIPLLAIALTAGLVLAICGGAGWRSLLRRLLFLQGVLVVLLVTLPFAVPGTPWFSIGPLTASGEGSVRALVILLKANAVTLAMLGLLGGLDPVAMGHALGRLRVPYKLVYLFLFSVRYLGLLYEESVRLRRAMRARCFVPGNNRHTWRSLGWLMGMLLVRSMARARRISAAMKCRGFQGHYYLLETPDWHPADHLFLAASGFGGTVLLVADKLT
jgi:cobalt/nickel transport system permease protein